MADGTAISEPGIEVFGSIVEAYRREGFDAGYKRAMQDLLAGLVWSSETFLHEQNTDLPQQELRKLLYAFVDRLEQQASRNLGQQGYVEGGLGI